MLVVDFYLLKNICQSIKKLHSEKDQILIIQMISSGFDMNDINILAAVVEAYSIFSSKIYLCVCISYVIELSHICLLYSVAYLKLLCEIIFLSNNV